MLSMVFGAMLASAESAYVITTLLKECGAPTFILTLIPIIGQAGLLLSLPGALALAKFEPKSVSIFMYSLGRGFLFFFVLALAFPGLFAGKLVLILFSAYAFTNLILALINGICQSWLKQVIREDGLGSLMGRRNALCAVIMGIFTPLIGIAIEKHQLLGTEKRIVFLWLMIFAIVTGFLDIWFLNKVNGTKSLPEKRPHPAFLEIKKAAQNKDLWQAANIAVMGNLGPLILTPFSILMFYELKFSEGMVALIIAVSTAGSAIGQVIGGHYADRLLVRDVFLRSAFIAMLGALVVLAVSIGIFSWGLKTWIACGILIGITILTSSAGGAFASANTKYAFRAVKDSFSVAFAFINLVSGSAMFCISLGAAKIGAVLSEKNEFLTTHLWTGCHYIQLILILSMGASLLSIWYLKRHNIYKLLLP